MGSGGCESDDGSSGVDHGVVRARRGCDPFHADAVDHSGVQEVSGNADGEGLEGREGATAESPVQFSGASLEYDRGGRGDGSALRAAMNCATMVRALARSQLKNLNAGEREGGTARRAGRQRVMKAGGSPDRVQEYWTSGLSTIFMARVGWDVRGIREAALR